jgi:asparaginyl-tRNA synthetase
MNDTTTLIQQMVAAAPVATRNVNLSTDPRCTAILR